MEEKEEWADEKEEIGGKKGEGEKERRGENRWT